MKKQLYVLLMLFSFSGTILLGGCKDNKDDDDDNNPQPQQTNEQKITSGTWIMKAQTIDPPIDINGTQVSNFYAQLDDCDKDDIMDLKDDKTYTVEEGATKCNQGDPQVIEDGDWNFNSDETVIIMTPTGQGSTEFQIDELSQSTLIIVSEETNPATNVKHTVTTTYAHP